MTGAMQAQPAQNTSMVTRLVDNAWSLLLFEQHRLTQDMTGAVRNLKATTSLATATGALVVASFVYGILHAVGPGHGKAVISSYSWRIKRRYDEAYFSRSYHLSSRLCRRSSSSAASM